jgi:hypothetical protein
MNYASGTYSKAQCDRCGAVVRYGTLRAEYKNFKRTGLMTCTACWDPQHPQDVPRRHPADPVALRDARPRNEIEAVGNATGTAFAPPGGQDYETWIANGGLP